MKYTNPIIHRDYSDPDVIRVGKDYFLVASSFNTTPCLPILHSIDLIHWEMINYVSENLPFSRYDIPKHGEGVWAPSIRYHNGFFYVFFSTPDEGIFMSKAKDPYGKWEELKLIKEVKGWIDPCPFWDDDGKAYLVNAFAKSRTGFNSLLWISQMNPDGTRLLDEGRLLFDGNLHHKTIEGPKLYKRNGFYYIFAPAGGVTYGWQTVLRSRNIYGPYEDKIVLSQGNTNVNGPHQGAWIEDTKGDNWFIHFQDKGAYGRIIHLQSMIWEDDWPQIGNNGEPVLEWNVPICEIKPVKIASSDDFTSDRLGLQWQWQANHKKEWYQMLNSGLRLFASNHQYRTLNFLPNVLTQKFPAETFTVTTSLTLTPNSDQIYAGLTVLGVEYYALGIKQNQGKYFVFSIKGKNNLEIEKTHFEVGNKILIKLEVKKNALCNFSIFDGNNFKTIYKDFQAVPGVWVGAVVGIFCFSKTKVQGFADFEYFQIEM